jgi:hypothetical protein
MSAHFRLSAAAVHLGRTALLWLLCSILGCGEERPERQSTTDAMRDATLGGADRKSDGGLTARDEPELDADSGVAPAAAVDGGDGGSAMDRSDAGVAPGVMSDVDGGPATSVLRGDPSATYWDLRVRGIGLDRFEGRQIVVRLGGLEDASERLATGSARVSGGSFELFFPQAWEANLYKLKRAYIDVDGNGSCSAAQDLVFMDARAAKIEVLEVRDQVSSPTRTDFARASDPAGECAALNMTWPMAF